MVENIIKGVVVKGNQNGRKFGFPTANVVLSDDYDAIISGVYRVEIEYDGVKYDGMANVGFHPTVGASGKRLIEVNIFNFNKNIYNQEVTIIVREYIRAEVKFNSYQELKNQIEKDKKAIELLIK